MDVEDIQIVAKATVEFLNLVEETKEPMYQGWDFIDYTLLCVHCEEFGKLTIDESIELVKALGFTVLTPEEVNNKGIIEPTFALNPLYDKGSLQERVNEYLEDNQEGDF